MKKKLQKSLHNLIFVLNLHSLSKTIAAKRNRIGLWCNGNTTVFGAVFQGSSPCRPTESLSILRGFFYLVKTQIVRSKEDRMLIFGIQIINKKQICFEG